MKKKIFTSLLISLFGLLSTTASAQPGTFYLSNGGSSYNILEGNTYTFTVNLYNISTAPFVVNVTTAIGTADSSDFTALSTTVTIPAGQLSSGSLTIATTNDAIIEPAYQYFIITGTVTSGITLNTTDVSYVSIIDNDTTPTISIYDNTITEGQNRNMTINLSNPFSSDVILNYSSAIGTANASDFTVISNTITIPAGQTSYTFNVATTNDATAEPDENFTINVTATSGNTANTTVSSNITIRDNDTLPTLKIGYTSTSENYSAFVLVSLNRPYNSNVVIQLVTSNGTAGASDYTSTSITRIINAGETYFNLQIPITDDTLDEPNETFTLTGTVTSANTTNTSATGTINIVDNDLLPDFVIYYSNSNDPANSSMLEEGDDAIFYIGLTQPSTSATVVQISTSNGTAGSLDYTPLTITATIPAGETYYGIPQFIVPTILDQLDEPNETFSINGIVTSGNTFNTSDSKQVIIYDNYTINAQPDTITSVAEVGGNFPLLTNDTLQGLPLNVSDATVALVGTNTIGATINALGVLNIPANAPMGYFQLNYKLCETANLISCDTTSVTVSVISPLKAKYNVSYSDYNADGYTSVGDVINYQFTITNLGNAPLTAIQIDQSFGGLTVLDGPIASLNAGQADSTTFSAIHILTQEDINYGFFQGPNQGLEVSFKGIYYGYQVTDFAEQENTFNLITSDGIRVKAFVDSNANGVQDGSEINFALGQFYYQTNNNGVVHNLYSSPFYLYESNPTTTYNLSYVVDASYAANNTCTVSYPSVTVPTGSGITTYNFPVTVTPYQELSVNLMSFNPPPRPGFYYGQYISYTNNSSQTLPSGTVTFAKDSALSIYSISEPSATNTATGFTYTFTNLLPYQSRYIFVSMLVPTIPTVALGQLVTNSVAITVPVGDIIPTNNISSVTQTIVGSYDPNDKTEAHGGEIVRSTFTANDYLTYTIRFENTGTANAINVKVEDFLDAKLEPSSIKMVDASATYSLERVGNHLIWKFSGIDLPPSIAETTTGKGYIVFQVKPKPGYAIGDIIPNSANIYFDFNPAIVTDPCITKFVSVLSTNQFELNDLRLFPNPVKNVVSISNSSTIGTVAITSVLGQEILRKKVNDLQTEIDLSSFANGIYFVKVTSNEQEKIIKIVKE